MCSSDLVVAAEVRALAQRSASAAKEIKTLIAASGDQVAAGNKLVEQAGATMHDIVGAIQRVTDIVAEITSASVEQSAGVAQINDAVTQMDKVTQQNAALVEQSAAAAESLKHHGLDSGRQFSPHVTMLKDNGAPRQAPLPRPIRWTATEFVLIHSDSALFEVVATWPLR